MGIEPSYRKQYAEKKYDLVTTWKGQELLDNELVDSFTIIFRTKGCSWAEEAGCLMCGYHTASNPHIQQEDILKQLEKARSIYDGERLVKIYTSGSFLDPREIQPTLGEKVLRSFEADKIIIESRSEFVKHDVLNEYSKSVPCLEVSIGLESHNDFVLNNCINKGSTVEDYRIASELIFEQGLKLRTYLLLKPPFLTEYESIQDLIRSISSVSSSDNTVSINPVNIQKDSFLEKLWYRGEYRPPWIWSIIESLINADLKGPIVISRAGLGSKRGAHNCGKCDERLISLIDEFNLTKDLDVFSGCFSICDCTELWRAEMEYGSLLHYRGPAEILSNRYAGYI